MLLLALGLSGCSDMVAAFQEGFESGSAPPVASDASPALRVPLDGQPAPLSDAPTRAEARTWLTAHEVCVVRDEVLAAGSGPLPGTPAALARVWSVLARAPADAERAADRVRASCVFARAAAWPEAERRDFLKQTALARDPFEALPPRPLVDLIGWIGTMKAVDPGAALAAHLSVLTSGEVATWLEQAGIVTEDDGEWTVNAEALEPLPDAVLEAIVARLDAGPVGPRAQVIRAVRAEQARR